MKNLGSKGVGTNATIAAVIITAIVVGSVTYLATPKGGAAPGEVTKSDVKDYLSGASESEVKEILKGSVPQDILQEVGAKKIKAGFLYVGPVGDFGWTTSHDEARKIVDNKFDWLTTITAESVAPADAERNIDSMFEAGADVVFTTSFSFMDPTARAAPDWPNKMLYNNTGFKTGPNLGQYMSEIYQAYYLNGMMAGALAKKEGSTKIGYVAAHLISEVTRHADAFLLGAQEIDPDIEMKVVETGAWYNPGASTSAAETLIDWGASSIAFTVDSTAVVDACQSHYDETGEKVYTFSHHMPMVSHGPDVVISGELTVKARAEVYEELLKSARLGIMENFQHWETMNTIDAQIVGSDWGEIMAPWAKEEIKNVTVDHPVYGSINAYDLIMKRYNQMQGHNNRFYPFTGPIYDSKGNLRLRDGEPLPLDNLIWHMDWYVEGATGPAP